MHCKLLCVLGALSLLPVVASQQLLQDSGKYGPPLDIQHYYFGQWPTGIAVSASGRKFSNFPSGLDKNNTNNGSNGRYAVAELTSMNIETAYPSLAWNTPPGGAINYTTNPPSSAGYTNHFIGVQSVVVDSADRLWALDTGRAIDPKTGMLTAATPGGAKLVGIHLSNNTIFKTIVFPPTVAYPDSYLNDVRFDLRPNQTRVNSSGVAYITDSSSEGRNGLVIVDLASGNSWRHLNSDTRTHATQAFVPILWGQPYYGFMPNQPAGFIGFGADGIALSADGSQLYFTPTSSRTLYSIPTSFLRDNGPASEHAAQAAVVTRGEKGVTDGMETDSNNIIYLGSNEAQAINQYQPTNSSVNTFVRDPRISWVDTMSVATDGYLYFTSNQLFLSPQTYPGTDRRVRPYALFRVKLPNGGTKIMQ